MAYNIDKKGRLITESSCVIYGLLAEKFHFDMQGAVKRVEGASCAFRISSRMTAC